MCIDRKVLGTNPYNAVPFRLCLEPVVINLFHKLPSFPGGGQAGGLECSGVGLSLRCRVQGYEDLELDVAISTFRVGRWLFGCRVRG